MVLLSAGLFSMRMTAQGLRKLQPNWAAYLFFQKFLIFSSSILRLHLIGDHVPASQGCLYLAGSWVSSHQNCHVLTWRDHRITCFHQMTEDLIAQSSAFHPSEKSPHQKWLREIVKPWKIPLGTPAHRYHFPPLLFL